MCLKVFASLSSCLRRGQVEPIDWKPSEPLSKSLSLPVGFVPMAPSSVLQAVLQKHGRAGMMDHLRPTHKDDRQGGMGWCWGRGGCPSTLLWQVQCFVSLLSWFLPADQTERYRGNTDARSPCTWLWMLGGVRVDSWRKCFMLDHHNVTLMLSQFSRRQILTIFGYYHLFKCINLLGNCLVYFIICYW